MTITRKNYQAMAKAIQDARVYAYTDVALQSLTADESTDTIGAAVNTTVDAVVKTLITVLKQDNPRFDAVRFMAATKEIS